MVVKSKDSIYGSSSADSAKSKQYAMSPQKKAGRPINPLNLRKKLFFQRVRRERLDRKAQVM
jgi:hypothetical protein